jgi:uncharacterized protein (TIGR00266 family)
MKIDILLRPGCSTAKVSLAPNETLTAEGGSMVAMSNYMSITTSTFKKNQGNILKAMKRMLSGESFFLNHYTPQHREGDVYLSPTLPGDMFIHEIDNTELIVQSGSYLGSSENINVDFSWQGMKSLFSGESLFWLKLTGKGSAIITSFGAIYPIHVDGEYIVDTGHIVAFEPGLSFTISKAGSSWVSSFLGGEGLVCRFKGKGTVWCQSHNPKSFGTTIGPKLKAR